jgi:hypothetical protein
MSKEFWDYHQVHLQELIRISDQLHRWKTIAELWETYNFQQSSLESVPFLTIEAHLKICFDSLDEIKTLTAEANKIQLEEFGG